MARLLDRTLLALAIGLLVLILRDLSGGSSRERIAAVVPDESIWGKGSIGGPATPRTPAPRSIVPADWESLAGDGETSLLVLARRLAEERSPGSAAFPWRSTPRNRLGPYSAVARTTVRSDREQVRMARLTGASTLWVNGVPFQGDPEGRGYMGVPVALDRGENELLVTGLAGDVELELWAPATRLVIGTWDVHWPSSEADDLASTHVSYPLFNASTKEADGIHLHYGHAALDPDRPFLSDWRCGLFLPPLTGGQGWSWLWTLGLDLEFEDVRDLTIAVPVSVFAPDDERADRQVLRGSVPGACSPEAHARVSRSGLVDLLDHGAEARAILVYGTAGNGEETAALLARARYDQQLVWYASGRFPIVLDDRRLEQRLSEAGRPQGPSRSDEKIVLYGSRDTNAAWERLVPGDLPLEARRGRLRVGERTYGGDDVFGWIRVARRKSEDASRDRRTVIAMVDTGAVGTRLGALLHPLAERAGASWDDELFLLRAVDGGVPEVLARGTAFD